MEDLDSSSAAAICGVLGLSPSSSASASSLLFATLSEDVLSTFSGAAGTEDFRTAGPGRTPAETSLRGPRGFHSKRPDSLVLRRGQDAGETSSDDENTEDGQSPAKALSQQLSKLLSPTSKKGPSGQSLSQAAVNVISSQPREAREAFMALVGEHRNVVVCKTYLESPRTLY